MSDLVVCFMREKLALFLLFTWRYISGWDNSIHGVKITY